MSRMTSCDGVVSQMRDIEICCFWRSLSQTEVDMKNIKQASSTNDLLIYMGPLFGPRQITT